MCDAKAVVYESVCCIGVPTCQMGIANTQELMKSILDYFESKGVSTKFLPQMQISGCNNSCARHQVSVIGLSGRKKKVGTEMKEAFEVYIGGALGVGITELGTSYGVITTENLPLFLCELAKVLKEKSMPFDEFQKRHSDELKQVFANYILQKMVTL